MKCSGILAGLCSAAALACAAAEAPAPAQYQDRLIDPAELPVQSDEAGAPYNPEGMPREWRAEGFASRIEQGGTIRHENGMTLSGRLETLEYGAISVNAVVRNNASANVVTLWQRGMPFDNGWRANNALGMINTPTIDLSRAQYRFFLPTFPVAGAQTEWLHAGDMQIQASAGSPGVYDGLRLPGFARLGGSVITAGAQWIPMPQWQTGVQVVDARNVGTSFDGGGEKVTGRSVYGAAAWAQGTDKAQVNLLDSQSNDGRHNLGAWIDAESRDGRYLHNFGFFRFDPHLSWGYTPVSADIQGAYYRLSYQSQQWIWSAGADAVSAVTERDGDGIFITGNARYQLGQSLGVGGGASWRRGANNAGSAFAFVDKRSDLGTTHAQVDMVASEGGHHAGQLSIDQAWPTEVGLRLSTTLSISAESAPDQPLIRRSSISAFGGIDLTNTLSLEGTLRYSRERGSSGGDGRYANLGLVWRIASRWSLVASYYDNRSEPQAFTTLDPLVPVIAAPIVPKDRAIFLTLRYENRAGTPVAPLGGMPGSGAGSIKGFVFYDANDDGRRGAAESGAANVTVVLDGRFGARTDNEGRFEFPFVASGPHFLSVIADNLALPYAVRGEGRREVQVRTRESTSVEIAATRLN